MSLSSTRRLPRSILLRRSNSAENPEKLAEFTRFLQFSTAFPFPLSPSSRGDAAGYKISAHPLVSHSVIPYSVRLPSQRIRRFRGGKLPLSASRMWFAFVARGALPRCPFTISFVPDMWFRFVNFFTRVNPRIRLCVRSHILRVDLFISSISSFTRLERDALDALGLSEVCVWRCRYYYFERQRYIE